MGPRRLTLSPSPFLENGGIGNNVPFLAAAMNATPNPPSQAESATPLGRHAAHPHVKHVALYRLRNAAIVALFAFALLIPKIIHLRRNERSWFAFRVVLAIVGAALVLLPLALWDSYLLSVLGLTMFVTAILLPSARPDTTANEKARELGALAVVNGGEYQPGNAPASPVQLYVGVENIWALDQHFQPLLVIPVRELSLVRAECAKGFWSLRLRWADHAADFSYRGIFAEHLVRTAEKTLHTVVRPALPAIPQRSRAASA
jgi:hypothetical protein